MGLTQANGSSPALLFGWGWGAHQAIEKASINSLPDSEWKQWLTQNRKRIVDHSTRQDSHHQGPDHYIDLELLTSGAPPVETTDRSYSEVVRAFHSDRREVVADHFRHHALQVDELQKTQNAFSAVAGYYGLLVKALEDIGANPPQTPIEITAQNIRLQSLVGGLAHYIGDIHQPMHSTSSMTWDLAHPWQYIRHDGPKKDNNAHAFFERELFRPPGGQEPEDYQPWFTSFHKNGYQARFLSVNKLLRKLARNLEATFMKMFDVVAEDTRARKTNMTAEAYHDHLRQTWRPIAEERLDAATQMMSDFLWSAWQAAGCPRLPKSPKPSVAPKSE